ncbi:MAG: hypothetical protein ACAI35_14445 [Candidatus Methylacidiphilales bacterium]|nr:hypothetical protein [Candidatus Methylacidiphilales bacterium]
MSDSNLVNRSRLPNFLYVFIGAMASLCIPIHAQDRMAHVDAAEKLVSELDSRNNEYAYKDPFIKWKGDAGVEQSSARCDCSAFVTLLLQHTYGYSADQIQQWLSRAMPVARIYHDKIEAGNGFLRVDRIDQMKRGDFIAVKYLAGTQEPGKHDTGHIMVVVQAPTLREASPPLLADTTQWEVVIIDSSKSGHGPQDTRRKPDKTFGTGVGRGILRLYADKEGKIAGYSWSTLSVSEFYSPDKHHVVVGRLDPAFKP